MKKLFFIMAVFMFSGIVFTSCTEEQVVPSTENGGGLESAPEKG